MFEGKSFYFSFSKFSNIDRGNIENIENIEKAMCDTTGICQKPTRTWLTLRYIEVNFVTDLLLNPQAIEFHSKIHDDPLTWCQRTFGRSFWSRQNCIPLGIHSNRPLFGYVIINYTSNINWCIWHESNLKKIEFSYKFQ